MNVSYLKKKLASLKKEIARHRRSIQIKNGDIKGRDPMPYRSEDYHFDQIDMLLDDVDALEAEIMMAE